MSDVPDEFVPEGHEVVGEECPGCDGKHIAERRWTATVDGQEWHVVCYMLTSETWTTEATARRCPECGFWSEYRRTDWPDDKRVCATCRTPFRHGETRPDDAVGPKRSIQQKSLPESDLESYDTDRWEPRVERVKERVGQQYEPGAVTWSTDDPDEYYLITGQVWKRADELTDADGVPVSERLAGVSGWTPSVEAAPVRAILDAGLSVTDPDIPAIRDHEAVPIITCPVTGAELIQTHEPVADIVEEVRES